MSRDSGLFAPSEDPYTKIAKWDQQIAKGSVVFICMYIPERYKSENHSLHITLESISSSRDYQEKFSSI